MWILTPILSFIGGPIVKAIIDAYKLKLANATQQDKLAVDLAAKEIEGEIAARLAARDIIVAEQGRWYTALPRPMFAYIFVIYIGKIVVWDKVLGWGTTDPLDPKMWEVLMVVVTAYFGGRSLEKIAQVFANRGRK